LASKLTNFEIDIEAERESAPVAEQTPESKPVVQKLKKKSELESSLLEAIEEHGTDTDK
jgi:hypothetical protein